MKTVSLDKGGVQFMTTTKPTAPTVTLKHLAAEMAEKHDMAKKQSEALLQEFIDRITGHLKKGNRVYWRGDAADSGIITEASWAAVTIAWDNGKTASVHHGDMREIQRSAAKSAPM